MNEAGDNFHGRMEGGRNDLMHKLNYFWNKYTAPGSCFGDECIAYGLVSLNIHYYVMPLQWLNDNLLTHPDFV